MGADMSSSPKPLQVNPIKLSAPMGAHLAMLGVDSVMPVIHGAQGCSNYSKVLFTRHFNEPIAVCSTAVNDVTAIMDGGKEIAEAVKNISSKVNPALIAIISTGLTETKGDDIANAAKQLEHEAIYVHTPDYHGGLEFGFAEAQKSIIEQLVEKCSTSDCSIATILPNVNISPIEVEKLKEFVNNFGFLAYALPDISTALDGHLGKKQGQVAQGGIKKDDIKNLAKSSIVISVGDSTKRSAKALMKKNPNIKHIHLDSVHGLESTDKLASMLINIKNIKPPKTLRRWRERLQDIYLDSHFLLGKTKVAIALEADEAYGVAKILGEVGASVEYVFTPTKSHLIFDSVAKNHALGDLEDLEKVASDVDILITNSHGKRIAKTAHKPLLLRGFPDYDSIGVGLKNDILYEGGCYLLKSIVSSLKECE
jgi:nitrogenase molybdenum-iron protein NifN